MILFENCLLNDHSHGIPIGITLKNINNIVTQLKTKLPHTRIILMSDPPRIKSGPNAIGLSYADYLEKTKEYAQAKHWEYIDVYKGFEKQRLSDGLALHQVMYDNNSHPNDIGYAYWYKILRKYFLTGQQ
ncbi:SGNH/GDSL hydrolase family protein [Terrilactibacillus sp. S3-3]|nr:SGNH/GDSL hydrolase family protein [Terrilactibacillus sp. S3-3]